MHRTPALAVIVFLAAATTAAADATRTTLAAATPIAPTATLPQPVALEAPKAEPAPTTAALAPTPAPAAPPKPVVTLVARIDLTSQRMDVIINGKPLHTWAISSGRRGFETPTGQFRPSWMARMWYSRTYDLAPMPHAVFFNDGIAVHATQATGMLGQPASHGCIRLAPANAATFYNLVTRHGLASTRVVVTGWPKFNAPAVARNNAEPRGRAVQAHGSAFAAPAVYASVSAAPQPTGIFGWLGEPVTAAPPVRVRVVSPRPPRAY